MRTWIKVHCLWWLTRKQFLDYIEDGTEKKPPKQNSTPTRGILVTDMRYVHRLTMVTKKYLFPNIFLIISEVCLWLFLFIWDKEIWNNIKFKIQGILDLVLCDIFYQRGSLWLLHPYHEQYTISSLKLKQSQSSSTIKTLEVSNLKSFSSFIKFMVLSSFF